jgi:hypothetical protein
MKGTTSVIAHYNTQARNELRSVYRLISEHAPVRVRCLLNVCQQ